MRGLPLRLRGLSAIEAPGSQIGGFHPATYPTNMANWTATQVTLTPNAALAPDGSASALRMTDTAVSAGHRINVSSGIPSASGAGQVWEFSVFAKAEAIPGLQVLISNAVASLDTWASFNLQTGAAGTSGVDASNISITPVPSAPGWYLLSFRFTTTAANTVQPSLYLTKVPGSAGRAPAYLGALESLLVWGANWTRIS